MKKSKLAIGLGLTILVAVGGGNVVHAKAAAPRTPMSKGDPIDAHNPQNKGLKSPHTAKKESAKRNKVVYQQEHQQKLHDLAKSHKGYTGLGQAGDAK